jgi:hypothetical protein
VAFFSVLHTHGNSLQLHPHLHVVLNSICLSKDKDKLFFLQDSLFNFDNFKSIFTQILKKELLSLLNKYPSLGDQFLFDTKNFKNESLFYYKKYDSPIQIIDYLSKTIKGSAINLDKVDFLDDGSVFLEKNNKYFKLSKVELIIRFIKQIIPSKIKSVRYSGFYSSASKDNLQIVNDLLNNTFEVIQPESDHTPEDESNIFSPIHKICPICKSKMILEENVDEYAVPNIVYIKFGKDPPTEQLFTRLVA